MKRQDAETPAVGSREASMCRRDMIRITAVAGVTMALGTVSVASLIREGRLRSLEVTEGKMGTFVTLSVVHRDEDAARGMISRTFAEMDRLEGVLTRHRPEAPLSQLNRTGVLHEAPLPLLEVVRAALRYAWMSGGAFDPTVQPVLDLAESARRGKGGPPSPQELAEVRERVGHEKVGIDGRTIRMLEAGMAMTLDGIAKGYIVDRALQHLLSEGARRVLVNAGGDLASAGSAFPGVPWEVQLQDPRDGRGSLGLVGLRGEALATSGDYVHRFATDHSQHHIVDPRTGQSPPDTSAVTVVAETAMAADALSTAAFVLGRDRGIDWLEGLQGVEGLVASRSGETRVTSGFPELEAG